MKATDCDFMGFNHHPNGYAEDGQTEALFQGLFGHLDSPSNLVIPEAGGGGQGHFCPLPPLAPKLGSSR